MQDDLTVDGQQIFMLGNEEWDAALRSNIWCGLPLCSPRTRPLVEAMLRFTRVHSEAFRLALCRDSSFAKTWTVMNLLVTPDGWRRVHVECVRCGACGTTQMIANPTVSDLYLGVADWAGVMKRATVAGPVRCVRCKENLPRFAIWAEVLEDE